ncbi:MAG: type II secretion system F family protein [Planctomycetes bacterium]|nr:type II secretion system F family protein [Planctomycetota bacterium]
MSLPMMIPILAEASELMIYLLPAIGSMLVIYGIFQVVSESRSSSEKKIQDRLRGHRPSQEKAAVKIVRRGALGEPTSFADTVLGKVSFIPKLQTLLDQADVDWSAPKMMMNLSGLALLVSIVLVALQFSFLAAVGAGVGVIVLPILWLNFKKKSRLKKLMNQLPDVFEMLSQALRAGHSLAGAIQLVYEQMPPPIATEFAQVYHEQNLGVKIEEALQSMANRVDSLDVRFFVTAVLIQRQTGGDLAEVLDNISGVIRERIELAGLVRGLTAEGRLSGWVLFSLPMLVFAGSLYLNPEYGNVLLEDPRGQIMLMVAVGMQLMGIAMIRWIVNIKV